jgi:hypothetical protein
LLTAVCYPGPSYNVAFFPKIYNAAGYPNILEHMRKKGVQEYGDPINWLLYQVRLMVVSHSPQIMPSL